VCSRALVGVHEVVVVERAVCELRERDEGGSVEDVGGWVRERETETEKETEIEIEKKSE
jgi:hypothetical protein